MTGDSMSPKGREITPASEIRLSLVQMIAVAIAIGGVGFSVGSLYPRLLSVELAVDEVRQAQQDFAREAAATRKEFQTAQQQTVVALERVTVLVDALERQRRIAPDDVY